MNVVPPALWLSAFNMMDTLNINWEYLIIAVAILTNGDDEEKCDWHDA